MGHYGLLVNCIITTSMSSVLQTEKNEEQFIFLKQTDMLMIDVMQEINFKDSINCADLI